MDSIPFRLQIELILLVLCFIYFIYRYVHKKKISVQYSIVWFISAFVMLGCAILPKVLGWLTNILGIEKTTALLDNYKEEMMGIVKEFPDNIYKKELEGLIKSL